MAFLIQKLRKEKGLSFIQASLKINISPFELLKYELGLQSPSSELVAKMISVYEPSAILHLNLCCFPIHIDSIPDPRSLP